MKTLFVAVFLILYFILTFPVYLILLAIGKKDTYKKTKYSQAIVSRAFRIIMAVCGVKKTVIGLENVPKDQSVLYVSNHRGYFDILLAYTTVPTLTGFVAKKEMNRIPFLRLWMRNLNCIFLDRENAREGLKTILSGIDLIKNGYSIFIAPEGTRSQGKEMLPFKEGSLKMAEKSHCPIIPVSMTNTDAAFERQFPWVRRAHVIIEFGQPVYIDTLSKEDQKFLGSYVQNIIRTTLEKNESLV